MMTSGPAGAGVPGPSSPILPEVARYGVIYQGLGRDERDAMPLGNGRMGVNLWVEEDGDLRFYLVRNDSFAEDTRLLKLGRVRVHLDPNPFTSGTSFRQELDLLEGAVRIRSGGDDNGVSLVLFCDPAQDALVVEGRSQRPRRIEVTLEDWRTQRRELTTEEQNSTRAFGQAPKGLSVWESADVFRREEDSLLWYHHNEWSAVESHVQNQGLSAVRDAIGDPLRHRTSGACIRVAGFEAVSDHLLRSGTPRKDFTLLLTTASRQMEQPAEEFPRLMDQIASHLNPPPQIQADSARWWHLFWSASHILVDEKAKPAMPQGHEADPAPPSRLTQAYLLARFVAACQNRDRFPLHFQGGMFIPGNEYMAIPRKPKMDRSRITPDFCFHGSHYWWQNVRLAYQPLLAQGGQEPMRAFLDFYLGLQPVFEAVAQRDYQAQGLFMRETITVFGLPSQDSYGWGKDAFSNGYTRDIWQQPLELACLMLDYADYTGDTAYLKDKLLPFIFQALRFFDTRFPKDASGKILIRPSHAVETYWREVENDMPTVAGLHAVTRRLQMLPQGMLSGSEAAFLDRFRGRLPDLPLRQEDGVTMLDHAQHYQDRRNNYEAPDLYAVFPFRIYGLGQAHLDYAVESFKRMKNPQHHCWMQTGLFAARLGLSNEAARDVTYRASLFIPGYRFPGYFNSPFDSPPDMDGAGNLQTALQEMLLQSCPYSSKLYLLPAWPKDWDVNFKLHAPGQTTVAGIYRAGKLEELTVVPAGRRADLILPDWLESGQGR